MNEPMRLDFDDLMRHLMMVGFFALIAWTLVSGYGILMGLLNVAPGATLRFLLSVLILVFSRRTYWEIREWRTRKLSPDERYGFANPLSERPRAAVISQRMASAWARSGRTSTGTW